MKNIKILSAAILFLALMGTACSTCYECEQDIVVYDGSNNPIDTSSSTEEFCTADKEEVDSKEEAGADCRVQ